MPDASGYATHDSAETVVAWQPPVMAILDRSAVPAPAFPLDIFGPFCRRWVVRAAEGANAPADFVAMPLLASASALIGNARWVCAWSGWAEPPALWFATVGNPSSGKTSGASTVIRDVLRMVEQHMARDYPAEFEVWTESEAVARAAHKKWEKDVAKALKKEEPVPTKPDAATIPPKPVRPPAIVTDATIEVLGQLLAALPKGLLNLRDELAGWLQNLSRYANGGTDRPFWLEAYNGGPYQVDRQKYPEPLRIRHLTLPSFGTIQPDRLADIFRALDDGLASRFLWAWPDEVQKFHKRTGIGDPMLAASALQHLADLRLANGSEEDRVPCYVRLSGDAQHVLEDFGQEMQRREQSTTGLLSSSIGKARGQALRLSLVLEFLWWCAEGGPEPEQISVAAMQAAAGLMDGYFVPMAARVLGDASIPSEERNARTVAGWIRDTRPEFINVSAIRDVARLSGLRKTEDVKAACRFLVEAHWLAEPPRVGKSGRPRGDFLVNPGIWGHQS